MICLQIERWKEVRIQKFRLALNSCKDFLLNHIIRKTSNRLRIIVLLMVLIKTFIFMSMIESQTCNQISINNMEFKFAITYLSFILIIYSFGFLLNKNKQLVFNLLFDILYTGILVFDLWYFRTNKDFYGLKNVFYPDTFNLSGQSLINFQLIDIVFFIDIIFILLWIIIKKIKITENRSIAKFSVTIRYSIIAILISFVCLDMFSMAGWSKYITASGWTTLMSARAAGPLGYHFVEGCKTIKKFLSNVSEEEEKQITEWLEYNKEDLPDNEFMASAKGKNVIFLQIEAFENFVVNKKANGKEITPFLNKLTKEGLYFNNIYQQNNAGNSIDCDFLVNTSVYPLGMNKITALYYGTNTYKNALPRILKRNGYNTISTHAEEFNEFNWTEIHKNSFGADKLWSIRDYKEDECVGYGLSDRSFYTQVADKLKNEQEPFFLQMPTLSSHGPFDIDKKYRELDLPEEIDKSYLGGYFESLHYADKQIEMFFNKLKEYGILENSLIVIYGDHAGVHKYYNSDIQELDFEGNWWKPYDNKIPLFIYGADVEGKTIENVGGQIDILPTVCYLLGIEKEQYIDTSMGRILVNTERNATVVKGNEIMGKVKDKEEEKHLLQAYKIGELIIKNDYFKNNN